MLKQTVENLQNSDRFVQVIQNGRSTVCICELERLLLTNVLPRLAHIVRAIEVSRSAIARQ